MTFLKSLRLDDFLSFAPGSEAISLLPLNVLIGTNGVGKSNFIEAIELLHATPTGFAQAIRDLTLAHAEHAMARPASA